MTVRGRARGPMVQETGARAEWSGVAKLGVCRMRAEGAEQGMCTASKARLGEVFPHSAE